MANTLTNLLPSMYAALDRVSRERIGMIPAVTRDGQTARAAIGQTVYSPVVPANTPYTITPAVDEPDTGDQTVGNVSITISNAVGYPIRFNGEETLGLGNAGTYDAIMQGNFEQGFRTLANQIETGLGALYYKAARAYGTAGTTPFGTADNLTDLAYLMQILEDNGAPAGDMRLVLSNAAMANLRGKQPTNWRVNEAGGAGNSARMDGTVGELLGWNIGQSGQLPSHTAGTGADYLLSEAGSIAEENLTVDTGTGTILAGDVVTFTGDARKYVNGTALAGGAIELNSPGLRQALADNTALTVGGSYSVAGLGFSRDAIVLATRLPAVPAGGDKAADRRTVIDPVSGLAFDVALYKEYRQNLIEISIAWGYAVAKEAHLALLLG